MWGLLERRFGTGGDRETHGDILAEVVVVAGSNVTDVRQLVVTERYGSVLVALAFASWEVPVVASEDG